MSSDEFGRERCQFFEIVQPKCSRRYGDSFESPSGLCTAQLGVTGTRKCYNSKQTCQDTPNYNPTDGIVLRFSRAQDGLLQYGYVIPMLESMRTAPGGINLAAMDDNMAALGVREVVNVGMRDALHDDHLVDPYRLERSTGEASLIHSGTVPSVSPTEEYEDTLPLASTASATDDEYATRLLQLTSGAGSVQERRVQSYDGATKVATVSPRWRVNLVSRSEELDEWQGAATVVANAFPDQDGENTLDTLIDDDAAGFEPRGRSITVPDDGATYLVEAVIRRDDAATQRCGLNMLLSGGTAVNVNPRFALDGTNVGGSGSPSLTDIGGGLWRLRASITNNGFGNTTLTVDIFPATSTTKSGSDQASAVGSMSVGHVHFRRSTDSDDYIKTEASAITLPTGGTGYQIVDAFDPYARGTFWGKWLARNPFHANYRCRVREGYIGQPLADMTVRSYIMDRIEGPNEGSVRIVAKDLFSRLEARKSVAPEASLGELAADITDVATSATLSPAGIGALDYPVTGSPGEFYVAIGDEIIRTQRSGDTLNFITRGALGTTASSHDEEDVVQVVLAYETMLAQDIVYDLLTVYGGIDPAQINLTEWDTLTATLTTLYTGYVAEPTPVAELVGELCQQAGFTVWHDVETDMIRIAILRASVFSTTIDDDAWIKDGSLSVKRQDDRRVSQVWVYYGQRNRKEDLEKRDNYSSRVVVADLDAEADEEYGVPKIREVFSRWIPQFGRQSATATGERILSLFRNPPLQAEFALHHSRLPQIGLTEFFGLRTSDVQDDTGEMATKTMAIGEIERGEHEIRVKAQEVNFFTAPDDTGNREIFIENDAYNLNLRTLHDGLFGAVPEGSPPITVTFKVLSVVTVGSTSTSSPAIRTGDWSDVSVNLVLEVDGRTQGKGGDGARGDFVSGPGAQPGESGGVALFIEHPCILTGGGEIFAGAGSGGGAGLNGVNAGGNGGGGAGIDGGAGLGSGSVVSQPGTADAGGLGGGTGSHLKGGDGGDPGQNGDAGASGSSAGAAGGAAGAAIDGVSLVTFTSPDELDIRGPQIN